MHRALVGDAFVLRLPATELFHGERLLAVALPGGDGTNGTVRGGGGTILHVPRIPRSPD